METTNQSITINYQFGKETPKEIPEGRRTIDSYNWNILYNQAEKYLKKYSNQIHIDRGCSTFCCYPEVDAYFPTKGNKKLIETLGKDHNLSIRRGYIASGIRYTKVVVKFQIDGTLRY